MMPRPDFVSGPEVLAPLEMAAEIVAVSRSATFRVVLPASRIVPDKVPLSEK